MEIEEMKVSLFFWKNPGVRGQHGIWGLLSKLSSLYLTKPRAPIPLCSLMDPTWAARALLQLSALYCSLPTCPKKHHNRAWLTSKTGRRQFGRRGEKKREIGRCWDFMITFTSNQTNQWKQWNCIWGLSNRQLIQIQYILHTNNEHAAWLDSWKGDLF